MTDSVTTWKQEMLAHLNLKTFCDHAHVYTPYMSEQGCLRTWIGYAPQLLKRPESHFFLCSLEWAQVKMMMTRIWIVSMSIALPWVVMNHQPLLGDGDHACMQWNRRWWSVIEVQNTLCFRNPSHDCSFRILSYPTSSGCPNWRKPPFLVVFCCMEKLPKYIFTSFCSKCYFFKWNRNL